MEGKMKTIFLTRKQYDSILSDQDAVKSYLLCKKAWSIGGVRITGKISSIAAIEKSLQNREQVASIEQLRAVIAALPAAGIQVLKVPAELAMARAM